MEKHQIFVNPNRVVLVLAAIALFLILVSLLGQLAIYVLDLDIQGLVTIVDLSRERNIPTFYTMFLLAAAGFLLANVAILTQALKGPDLFKWSLLSGGFLAMAYDEGFQVHEYFIAPVRSLLGGGDLGAFHYAWVVPGMGLVFVLGLFFLRFLFRLTATTRNTFILAATLYLGGCLGIELIGGHYDATHGYDNLTYNLISTLEEGLEMAGLIVFIYGLIGHLGLQFTEIQLRFGVPELPIPNLDRRRKRAA